MAKHKYDDMDGMDYGKGGAVNGALVHRGGGQRQTKDSEPVWYGDEGHDAIYQAAAETGYEGTAVPANKTGGGKGMSYDYPATMDKPSGKKGGSHRQDSP